MLRPSIKPAQKGFSLVEALTVILVLGIVASIAVPNFQTLIANSKVRTAAEGILVGLKLARAEAIRLNTDVSFTLGSGSGWTVAVVSPSQGIQARPGNEAGGNIVVTSTNDQSALTFQSTGRVKDYSAATNLSRLAISSAGTANTLQIDVFAGGGIRMCSPGVTDANDPRAC